MSDLKKILIVEDDKDLSYSIKSIFEKYKYTTILAFDGEQGYEMLSAEKDVSLIVSDIRMPKMDGISLLKKVRKENIELPFIVMTGFSELLETKSAYDYGANGFLSKPFRMKELISLVSELLDQKEDAVVQDMDGKYTGIEIENFLVGSQIDYPIFIKLSQYKYIRIANKGMDIDISRINNYKDKGLTQLFLKNEDYEKYVSLNKKILKVVREEKINISNKKKTEIIKSVGSVIMENIFMNEIDQQQFEESMEVMDSTIKTVKQQDEMFKLIEDISKRHDQLYAHSLCVSMFATMLAKKLGWVSERNVKLISLGGLYHDVGKKILPEGIINKNILDITYEERKEFETHPLLGAEILQNISKVPDEVIQICLQHHENCMGTGYPNKTRSQNIYPLAKVVSVANEFMNALKPIKEDEEDGYEVYREALRKILIIKKKFFEPEHIQKFATLFKSGQELLEEFEIEENPAS